MADKTQVGRESIELAADTQAPAPNGATNELPSSADPIIFTRKRLAGFYATVLLVTISAVAVTGVRDSSDLVSASIAVGDKGGAELLQSPKFLGDRTEDS